MHFPFLYASYPISIEVEASNLSHIILIITVSTVFQHLIKIWDPVEDFRYIFSARQCIEWTPSPRETFKDFPYLPKTIFGVINIILFPLIYWIIFVYNNKVTQQ